ncbi:Hypothetical protein HDN1F_31910 [gamma proteobacterium HdN1]|nr:Hypothetical protein HDN1F_31910 [gamma proteobacterium HdN1]
MKTAHGDFRRYERTNLRLPIGLEIGNQHLDADTMNISQGGIALAKNGVSPLTKGQVIKVNFKSVAGMSTAARVVHVGPEHVGLSLHKGRLTGQDMDSLIDTAPTWQQLNIKVRRSIWTLSRRAAVLSVNTFLRPLLMAWVRPRFLFAAYGSRKDVETYLTPRMAKLLPPIMIGGFIRNGKQRGFMVASKYLESELASSSERVRDYLENLKSDFGNVQRIALVGRLPNFVLKSGIPIENPFVSGAMGTRFMIWDVARQMKALPQYRDEQGIVVLGGAGRIGNPICEDLLSIFKTVIAFDTRYEQEEVLSLRGGTLVKTARVERLGEHKMFIGLTHHGDVIGDWAAYMQEGSMIADDTHPCISMEVREKLAAHGVKTMKIVLGHQEFSMMPRLPSWNNRDIPGCLVEALVLLDHENEVAENFDLFSVAATNAGFKGRLIEPLDE